MVFQRSRMLAESHSQTTTQPIRLHMDKTTICLRGKMESSLIILMSWQDLQQFKLPKNDIVYKLQVHPVSKLIYSMYFNIT